MPTDGAREIVVTNDGFVEFWEARRAFLSALGGYGNLRYQFSSVKYQRTMRKARRGELHRSELMECLGHIAARKDIPSVEHGDARAVALTVITNNDPVEEDDGPYYAQL